MASGEARFFAFLAVFLTLIGFVLALLVKRKDTYVIYYAKQGLILFLFAVFLWLVNLILDNLAVIDGDIVGQGFILLFILTWTVSWINSLSGSERAVPIIGKLGEKIKL